MPKSMYANKVGMMYKMQSQHIGKAPSLHFFTLQLDSTWQSSLPHAGT